MKYTGIKKIRFCLKIDLLMRLFFNFKETSSAVLLCVELEIAFLKFGLERNTNRTVIQLVPFEAGKANDCTVWGVSTDEQSLNSILFRNLFIIFVRSGPFLVSRFGEKG